MGRLADCAGQNVFFDGSDGQARQTTRSRGYSEVNRRRRRSRSGYGVVETVPEAGEQQPNVSLANADKIVVGRTMLSQRRQKISGDWRETKSEASKPLAG
jgi:hypothetical protein